MGRKYMLNWKLLQLPTLVIYRMAKKKVMKPISLSLALEVSLGF
jgi:hypothetical protein